MVVCLWCSCCCVCTSGCSLNVGCCRVAYYSKLWSLLQVMDVNKDGFITFEEFAKWWGARKNGK